MALHSGPFSRTNRFHDCRLGYGESSSATLNLPSSTNHSSNNCQQWLSGLTFFFPTLLQFIKQPLAAISFCTAVLRFHHSISTTFRSGLRLGHCNALIHLLFSCELSAVFVQMSC
ncbi:hypothetical protein ILYODFUR_016963 [Ilyodon furcidens]|uniref:Uncharacterized protein n=1 Tax=Ilyodon furcidens TaxID=33524 RepID=A0ABV0VG61_9TELE